LREGEREGGREGGSLAIRTCSTTGRGGGREGGREGYTYLQQHALVVLVHQKPKLFHPRQLLICDDGK